MEVSKLDWHLETLPVTISSMIRGTLIISGETNLANSDVTYQQVTSYTHFVQYRNHKHHKLWLQEILAHGVCGYTSPEERG